MGGVEGPDDEENLGVLLEVEDGPKDAVEDHGSLDDGDEPFVLVDADKSGCCFPIFDD